MCLCNGYGCSNCEPWFYDNAAQENIDAAKPDKQLVKPKIVSEVAEEYYDRIEKQCDC